MNCRFCKTHLEDVFIDLVNSPASNSFLVTKQLNEPETFFPLKVYVCKKCYLVQIDEYKKSDAIFDKEYVYFSSYSDSWLAHSKAYVDMMVERFDLNSSNQVVEIASNDGYLLQYFKQKNIPVKGIEPTANTAAVAQEKGIESIVEFFGEDLAKKLVAKNIFADVLLGNNVLAHVPDINDFVKGMKILLSKEGVITMEFPHLQKLIENVQFDTIYHEHFSYLSLHSVKSIFSAHGLNIFDVEEIPTHGGSLRIFAAHEEYNSTESESLKTTLLNEEQFGITKIDTYKGFQQKAEEVKNNLLLFLIKAKNEGKRVAGYGAAAKGNTLLNFCGIKSDLIEFVVDANPHKQNKFLPGSHIPVYGVEKITEEKPDYLLILPWNLKDEIVKSYSYISDWDAKFVVAIPQLTTL